MKLSGITVIDLSMMLPGPYMTMIMADHGANVIKIEPHPGDPSRKIPPSDSGHSIYFRNTNRGKRSLRLNLKEAKGRQLLLRLISQADVLIEAFRPGVAQRLGIGYAAVKAIAPQLIYCSISAFGQAGLYRDKPAHDLAVTALAGTALLNVGADGNPALPAMPVSDVTASLMALSGILMALLRRQQTNEGDYLDIALYDTLLASVPNFIGRAFKNGSPARVKDDRIWGGAAFYNIYETKDGKWLALAGTERKFANNFLAKAGMLDLLYVVDQPAGSQAILIEQLTRLFKEKTLDEWSAWLDDVDVCFAPLRTLTEAVRDPNAVQREMVLQDSSGNKQLGVPIKFLHEPARPNLTVPELGEHSRGILISAGYSDTEIEQLYREGII